MKAIVRLLSSLSGKHPLTVLITIVVLTAIFGGLASEVVITDGNEGFAPDAEELLATDRIEGYFGEGSQLATLQVVISSESGDVVTTDGLAAVEEIESIIRDSDLADLLVDTPDQPAVISFMVPLQQAIASGDVPAPGSDSELKGSYSRAFEMLPPDIGGVAQQLMSQDRDLEAAEASKGLLLVFIDAPGFDEKIDDPGARTAANDFETFTDLEGEVAEEIRSAPLAAGLSAEPFSFELIFGTGDEFQTEVGRLFGNAAAIIVIILLFVYFVGSRVEVGNVGDRNALFTASGLAVAVGIILALLGAGVVSVIVAVALGVYAFFAVRRARWRRTNADMLLTMAAIFMAITWMNGIGVLLGPKFLNVIDDFGPMAQIVPILLIGLGVDYAIHLTTRYREEVGAGSEVIPAMGRSIHTVGVALILATVTTAVGFLTNLVSPIPALQQFGILAAVGIGASFLIMLTFVASFRTLLDRRAERNGRLPADSLGTTRDRLLPTLIGKTSVLAERFAWQTVIAAVALGVVGFLGVLQLKAEFSVTDFVPRPNPLLPTFQTLIDDFGGGFGETTQVLIEGTIDADGHNALVASLDNLRDTENVLQFGDLAAADSIVGTLGGLIDQEGERFDPAVAAAAAEAGVGPDLSVGAGADIGALYDAVLAAAPNAGTLVHADGSGGYDALLVNITTQGGESGAGRLNQDVRTDFAPISEAGLEYVPTSDEIINDVVITALSDSQLSSLIITILAAAALLMVNFLIESRRPFLGLITIFPVALVMLWAFGLMPVFGLAFGPVTATVSALAIGIGVPYMIHITHRFQEDRIRCVTPAEAVRSTTTNTGGALAGSAFTTVAGFGILMTASLVPFRQLGLVTAYTILLALVGAVIVLPSMLAIWDGWHRKRGDIPMDPESAIAD